MLIRPVPNFARSQGFQLYEGIIETDSWFGPLFTNVRLIRTEVPIEFKASLPLFHLQPVERRLYEGRLLDDFQVVDELSDWTTQEWDGYRKTVVAPNLVENRPPGQHAVNIRRRRRRSFDPTPVKLGGHEL